MRVAGNALDPSQSPAHQGYSGASPISTLGGRAKAWLSNRAKSIALELLDHHHHDNYTSTKVLSGAIAPRDVIPDARFSVLHCVRIALALAGVNERGDAGITPLIWAARRGHEVVELLLGREDVNLHFLDNSYDKTPLLWAAKNGYEGV